MKNPFRYFNSSPEVIRLAVTMYVRCPLSPRQVEDLLFERSIDIFLETVGFRWNRFGSMFVAEIRKRRVDHRLYSNWRRHLDEVCVRINGKTRCLRRAVDHEGEVLEVFATKRGDRQVYRRWHNHRAESLHRPFRRREGATARFRDVMTLQKFASIHTAFHNHVNLERHLMPRETFRQNRLAALAKWRQPAASRRRHWRIWRLVHIRLTTPGMMLDPEFRGHG
jgi:putative transposase